MHRLLHARGARRYRPRWLSTVLAVATITAVVGSAAPAFAEDPDTGPHVTISGRVLDGSGHGWPLLASISGTFGDNFHNDPVTGRYEVSVPVNDTYYFFVGSEYPGYNFIETHISVGTDDVVQDFHLSIDTDDCNAPGYRQNVTGLFENFNSLALPPGWAAPDDYGWAFVMAPENDLTRGDHGQALAEGYRPLGSTLSELRTPVVNLTNVAAPVIRFNTNVAVSNDHYADIELSVDSGQTWSNVWHFDDDFDLGPIEVPIPAAAGKPTVQVRFVYDGDTTGYWRIDNVIVGQRSCDPVHGGLIVGRTLDGNTGDGLDDSTVESVDQSADRATSYRFVDTCQCPGFFQLFSTLVGDHGFTASHAGYTSSTKTVDVGAETVTWADFRLGAGRIAVTPNPIGQTLAMGAQSSTTLTVTNTGTLPTNVTLDERADPGQSRDQPWREIASLPKPLRDNATVAADGKIYSIGGSDGFGGSTDAYVYDPWRNSWTAIKPMQRTRSSGAAAFIGGKLYAVGGLIEPTGGLEIYDPAHDSWSFGAEPLEPLGGSGVAVLNGRIYAVGSCNADSCAHSGVQVYNPASNSWAHVADYPVATSFLACGGLLGRVYCAGGRDESRAPYPGAFTKGFSYDPATNAWSPIPDLPIELYATSYAATSNALVLSGGVTSQGYELNSRGFSYNPGTQAWTEITMADQAIEDGGGACGFYRIGGALRFDAVDSAAVLPGFDQCGSDAEVSWLSMSPTSLTLAPGASARVTVKLDASAVNQPGDHNAWITFATNTPYDVATDPVTMTVTPPAAWGSVTGMVTGAGCDATAPLGGALVQVMTASGQNTVLTDADGSYTYWLAGSSDPVTIIVAKDGWHPQIRQATITAGHATTVNWSLIPVRPCQRP